MSGQQMLDLFDMYNETCYGVQPPRMRLPSAKVITVLLGVAFLLSSAHHLRGSILAKQTVLFNTFNLLHRKKI